MNGIRANQEPLNTKVPLPANGVRISVCSVDSLEDDTKVQGTVPLRTGVQPNPATMQAHGDAQLPAIAIKDHSHHAANLTYPTAFTVVFDDGDKSGWGDPDVSGSATGNGSIRLPTNLQKRLMNHRRNKSCTDVVGMGVERENRELKVKGFTNSSDSSLLADNEMNSVRNDPDELDLNCVELAVYENEDLQPVIEKKVKSTKSQAPKPPVKSASCLKEQQIANPVSSQNAFYSPSTKKKPLSSVDTMTKKAPSNDSFVQRLRKLTFSKKKPIKPESVPNDLDRVDKQKRFLVEKLLSSETDARDLREQGALCNSAASLASNSTYVVTDRAVTTEDYESDFEVESEKGRGSKASSDCETYFVEAEREVIEREKEGRKTATNPISSSDVFRANTDSWQHPLSLPQPSKPARPTTLSLNDNQNRVRRLLPTPPTDKAPFKLQQPTAAARFKSDCEETERLLKDTETAVAQMEQRIKNREEAPKQAAKSNSNFNSVEYRHCKLARSNTTDMCRLQNSLRTKGNFSDTGSLTLNESQSEESFCSDSSDKRETCGVGASAGLRFNRAFSLRRARLLSDQQAREKKQNEAKPKLNLAPTANPIRKSLSASNFSRSDGGRFSLRAPELRSIEKKGAGSAKQQPPRGCASAPAKKQQAQQMQNWKRRQAYDPLKAAAEGRKKEQEGKSKSAVVNGSDATPSPRQPANSPVNSAYRMSEATRHSSDGGAPSMNRSISFHNSDELQYGKGISTDDDFSPIESFPKNVSIVAPIKHLADNYVNNQRRRSSPSSARMTSARNESIDPVAVAAICQLSSKLMGQAEKTLRRVRNSGLKNEKHLEMIECTLFEIDLNKSEAWPIERSRFDSAHNMSSANGSVPTTTKDLADTLKYLRKVELTFKTLNSVFSDDRGAPNGYSMP